MLGKWFSRALLLRASCDCSAGTEVRVLCTYPVDRTAKVQTPLGAAWFVSMDDLAPIIEEPVVGRTLWERLLSDSGV